LTGNFGWLFTQVEDVDSQTFVFAQLFDGSVDSLMFVTGDLGTVIDRLLNDRALTLASFPRTSPEIRNLSPCNLYDPTRQMIGLP
jgi:hypothetical protein